MTTDLRGVIPITATPFDTAGQVDEASIATLVEFEARWSAGNRPRPPEGAPAPPRRDRDRRRAPAGTGSRRHHAAGTRRDPRTPRAVRDVGLTNMLTWLTGQPPALAAAIVAALVSLVTTMLSSTLKYWYDARHYSRKLELDLGNAMMTTSPVVTSRRGTDPWRTRDWRGVHPTRPGRELRAGCPVQGRGRRTCRVVRASSSAIGSSCGWRHPWLSRREVTPRSS
jgi:hypothetical protein